MNLPVSDFKVLLTLSVKIKNTLYLILHTSFNSLNFAASKPSCFRLLDYWIFRLLEKNIQQSKYPIIQQSKYLLSKIKSYARHYYSGNSEKESSR